MLSVMLAAFLGTAATPAGAATDDNRLVCRETARTGTRFARRVCKTAAEWRAIEEQSQRDLGEMRDRPALNRECTPPSC